MRVAPGTQADEPAQAGDLDEVRQAQVRDVDRERGEQPWLLERLEAEARDYDHVIERDGVKIFIDPTSMMYLDQATIDYVDSIMGGGFKIDNPNAVTSCGCGSSFKAKNGGAYEGPAGGGCGCGH